MLKRLTSKFQFNMNKFRFQVKDCRENNKKILNYSYFSSSFTVGLSRLTFFKIP